MKKYDYIIIITVLLIALTVFSLQCMNIKSDNLYVSVTVDGVTKDYQIDEERTIILDTLKIIIYNNSVRVTDSSCRDKICVNTGIIEKAGQFIACVPAKVFIKIISGSGENYADWISG